MNALKMLLAISAVTVAFAAPAMAQNMGQLSSFPPDSALIINSAGRTTMIKPGRSAHAMIMRHARPVGAGVILFRSGGRLYMAHDQKMPGGHMLSEMIMDRQLVGRGIQ
jgi:hypothetical protein